MEKCSSHYNDDEEIKKYIFHSLMWKGTEKRGKTQGEQVKKDLEFF